MKKFDAQLAAQAGNDAEAFTDLYENYAPKIFVYFQYRCGDTETSQDLTAEVFERLLAALPGYNPERAPFTTWLFAIARHVATDWLRRQYLRKFLPWQHLSKRPSNDNCPELTVMESEERQRLRQALHGLSDRERDLLGLRFSSGLSNQKIAELSGMSENHVAVVIYRALRKLYLRLQALEETIGPEPAPVVEVNHE